MIFSSYILYKIIIGNTSLTNDYKILFKYDDEYIKSLKWL